MTYDLFLGDRLYSSWSLRGWLMCEAFGLPHRDHFVGLYTGTMAADLAGLAPARLVPAMRTPEGIVVGETLAMAETLAERHPEAGLWPDDPAARALARWLAAEMHAGFAALRAECPMNLAHAWEGVVSSDAVRADVARAEALWSLARARHGMGESPWLFGRYSLADVLHAPLASRIATYGLAVGAEGAAYVAAHLAEPRFLRWRREGLAHPLPEAPYAMDLPVRPWPGPE